MGVVSVRKGKSVLVGACVRQSDQPGAACVFPQVRHPPDLQSGAQLVRAGGAHGGAAPEEQRLVLLVSRELRPVSRAHASPSSQ